MAKRRTYKRKKSSRRRRGGRNAPILRRIIYAPCKSTVLIPIYPSATGDVDNAFSFSRFQVQSLFGSQYGINSGSRFTAMRKNWEQFAVTGMKIEWIPSQRFAGALDGTSGRLTGIVQGLFSFDDIDTSNTANYTLDTIAAKETFVSWDPARKMTIYRNNKPLAKQ